MDFTDEPVETWTVMIDADTSALESQMQYATKLGKQFSGALVNAFEGLALKGKSLGEVFRSLAMSLSSMVLKAAFKPLEQGLGSMFSGLLGGGLGGGLGFAKGGVFQQGTPVPFAKGGVIASPIAFPVGSRMGIAAERGAEAIMPLARGADGRLGVVANGAGGGMSVTFNVQTADAESFRRFETQVAAMLARAVSLGQRNL